MKIPYNIKRVQAILGIAKLRAHQMDPIQDLLNGRDVFVNFPTASGKSLIFQIPALLHPQKWTLVLEPTLSLMLDQVQHLQAKGIPAEHLARDNRKQRETILSRLTAGEISIFYTTPEQLLSPSLRNASPLPDRMGTPSIPPSLSGDWNLSGYSPKTPGYSRPNCHCTRRIL